MSHYTPRRKIIKKIQKRQKLHESWLSLLASLRLGVLSSRSHFNIFIIKVRSLTSSFKSHFIPKLASFNRFKPIILLRLNALLKNKHYLFDSPFKLFRHILRLEKYIWSSRGYIVSVVLITMIFNNINGVKKEQNKYIPSVNNINIFPTLPHSWTKLSQIYFLNNQEDDAEQAFMKAKKYYSYYPQIIGSVLYGAEINNTQRLLQSPVLRRKQLEENEKILQKYPYSWQLWAIKAKYEKELYLEEQFQSSIKIIEWLYPNNEIVRLISQ